MKIKQCLIFFFAIFLAVYGVKSYTKQMIKKPLVIAKSSVPKGDFWAVFPGPHVERWNPELVKNSYRDTGFIYGPVFYLFSLPFTFMRSINDMGVAILVVYNLMFWTTFLIWYFLLFGKTRSIWPPLLMFVLWATFAPMRWVFVEFNIEIVEMFLISVSLLALLKGKQKTAGTVMGFAAMTKFLPLIFLPYFLVKRQFKAFLWMLGTVAVIVVLAQFIYGWENNPTVARKVVEPVSTYFRSQSLNTLIYRFFSDFSFAHSTVLYPKAAYIVNKLVHAVVISWLLFLFIRNRNSRETVFEFALLSTWMITTIPHSHMYYLCFLVFPFSVILKYLMDKSSDRKISTAILFAIPYILTSLVFTHQNYLLPLITDTFISKRDLAEKYWNLDHLFWTFSLPALGLFLLLILLGWIYGRRQLIVQSTGSTHFQHQ